METEDIKAKRLVFNKYMAVYNGHFIFGPQLKSLIEKEYISVEDALNIILELMYDVINYNYNESDVYDEFKNLTEKVKEFNDKNQMDIKGPILFFKDYSHEKELFRIFTSNFNIDSQYKNEVKQVIDTIESTKVSDSSTKNYDINPTENSHVPSNDEYDDNSITFEIRERMALDKEIRMLSRQLRKENPQNWREILKDSQVYKKKQGLNKYIENKTDVIENEFSNNLSDKEHKKLKIKSDYLSNKIKYTIKSYSRFIYEINLQLEQIDDIDSDDNLMQMVSDLKSNYNHLIDYQKKCNDFKQLDSISNYINIADSDLKKYKQQLSDSLSYIRRFKFYNVEYQRLLSKARFFLEHELESYEGLNSKLNILIDNVRNIKNDFAGKKEFFTNLNKIRDTLYQQFQELTLIKKDLLEITLEKGKSSIYYIEKINFLSITIDKISEIDLEYTDKLIIEMENEYEKINQFYMEVKSLESNFMEYTELMCESNFLLDYYMNLYDELNNRVNKLFKNSVKINGSVDENKFREDLEKIRSQLIQKNDMLKMINKEANNLNNEKSISISALVNKVNVLEGLINQICGIDLEYNEKSISKLETIFKNPNPMKSKNVEELLNDLDKFFNRPMFMRRLKKFNLENDDLDKIKNDIKIDIISHEISGENVNIKTIIETRCRDFRKNNSRIDEHEIDNILKDFTFSEISRDVVEECKDMVKVDFLEGNITINQVELKLNNYINKKLRESNQLEELERIKNNPRVPSIKLHLTQEENEEIYIITKQEITSEYGIEGNVENRVYFWMNKKIRENQSEARGRLNSIKREFSTLTKLDMEQQNEFIHQIEFNINDNKIKYYEITEEYIVELSEDFINYGKLEL